MRPTTEQLVEAYLPLAKAMARVRSERRPRLRADWFSAAYLGLFNAARDFDEARSKDFATFARYHIKSRFRDVRLASRPRGYRRRWDGSEPAGAPVLLSFDAMCDDRGGDEDRAPVPGSREPAPDVRLIAAEREAEVAHLLALLPPRRAAVLRGLYLEGKPYAAVAAELGIAVGTVRSTRAAALAQLRESA